MAARAELEYKYDPKKLDQMIRQLTEAGKKAGLTEKQIHEMTSELENAGKKGKKSIGDVNEKLDKTNRTLDRLGKAIIANFAIDKVVDFGKKVVNTTAEFQKLIAVLKTGLGSDSEAQAAFAQIQTFAANTPFQVQGITESYVKLVNRGIQPANKQLTAMGDFAASTGKDIDQLTEAILDVSNTERWNEFGVKVKSSGDKIKATFKGVTVEAEKTERGALKVIEQFGAMQGISGSMAAISETLGGKLSNLEDSLDALFFTIGNGSSGALSFFIEKITLAIESTNDFFKTIEMQILEDASKELENVAKGFEGLKTVDDVNEKIREMQSELSEAKFDMEQFKGATAGTMEELDEFEKEHGPVTIDQLKQMEQQYQKAATKTKVYELAIAQLNKMIKQLNIEQEKAAKKAEELQKKLDAVLRTINQQLAEDLEKQFQGAEKAAQEGVDAFGELEKAIEESLEAGAKEFEELTDAERKALEENERIVQEWKESWEILEDQAKKVAFAILDTFGFTFDLITTGRLANLEREKQALDSQKEYELSLAGDNVKEKERIEEEYQTKLAAIKRREDEANRKRALFQIAVDTAANAVKLFAQTIPPGILSAIAIGQGILQAATVNAAQPPAYARGKYKFRGKGTTTSDDNLVRISDQESITPAKKTNQFGWLLKPLIEKENFSNKDLANLVMSKIPYEVRGDIMQPKHEKQPTIDYEKLGSTISKPIVSEIRRKPTANIIVDNIKYGLSLEKQNSVNKYLSDNYNITVR